MRTPPGGHASSCTRATGRPAAAWSDHGSPPRQVNINDLGGGLHVVHVGERAARADAVVSTGTDDQARPEAGSRWLD